MSSSHEITLNNSCFCPLSSEKNETVSKKWYTLALIIGSLTVGVGIFGMVGLLHSYKLITLPFLQEFTLALGAPGLWSISMVSLVLGSGLIGFGTYRLTEEKFEEVIETIKHPKINPSQLSNIPPKETFGQDLNYDLSQLLDWFDAVCPKGEYRAELATMITDISTKNPALFEARPDLPLSFYDNMTLYLNNIIDALSKQPERKKDVLTALAEGANVCPPTWYETARKQLKSLRHSNDGETQLLQWVQEIKEEIVLELAQTQFKQWWHGLNYVRYHVGGELGLNREGLENDPHISKEILERFSKSMMIELFKANYTAERLITAIEIKVNARYQQCFFDMLKLYLMKLGKDEPSANDYIASNFYEDDFVTLNREGIAMLLKSLSII